MIGLMVEASCLICLGASSLDRRPVQRVEWMAVVGLVEVGGLMRVYGMDRTRWEVMT